MAAVGQAGGEGQAQQQAAQEGGQQAPGTDLTAINEALSGLATGQEEMRQFLASNPWQQQAPEDQGGEEEGLDLSFLFPEQQSQLEQFGDQDALQSQFGEAIKTLVSQQAQQLLAPVQAEQQKMRREAEATHLASEFPELATPEMAEKIAGRGGLAEQAAQQLGMPQLAAEPKFWRLVYGFHKVAELANQGPEGSQAAPLESGGGAGPTQVTEADLVKQIVSSGDGLGAGVLNGI